ncbi:MAG: aminotransferase class IV [Anaerolineae bacterium]|nr:aminotransferase class IV [Anaerolineae bacterium]MCB0254611.1 aminotransferase class IV [Anaerolineae bacterium]
MTLPMVVSRNGHFISPADAHISIFNPVIFGAFGVYESIQIYAGVIFLLEDHLLRLADSAAAIDLTLPGDQTTIARWTREVVAANHCRDGLIRIFALGATADNGPEIFIWPEGPRALPAELYEQGAGAVSYIGERALPHAKSLNTLVNHMAKARALLAGEHEGVLVDGHGNVTEGSSSNLFVVIDGVLLTAPEPDVLAGVTQIEVLDLAEQLGIPLLRETLPLADRNRWHEAFLTSTSRHVLPLVRLDGQPIGAGVPGPITLQLRQAFEERFISVVQAGSM